MFLSSGKVTDRQTDRKRSIRTHRAICTGGLKNWEDNGKIEQSLRVRPLIIWKVVQYVNKFYTEGVPGKKIILKMSLQMIIGRPLSYCLTQPGI